MNPVLSRFLGLQWYPAVVVFGFIIEPAVVSQVCCERG